MAFSLFIPASAFLAGGPMEGTIPADAVVPIPLKEGGPTYVTATPQTFEDWEFHPSSSGGYAEILKLVDRGVIEFNNGSAMSPTDLITLFKTYYQEL